MDYDVIIIGGGITGAGAARDCAMRGLRTLLIERGDIATGATGRNHGLLHSGARYALNDPVSAAECIKENRILRKIARHCIEDTKGLFITLPEDEDSGYGLDYQKKFIQACRASGISAEALDPREALRLEPSVNPALTGAVLVPDGAVDPFRLCAANILDAKLHGSEVLFDTEFIDFIKDGFRIVGVKVLDRKNGTAAVYNCAIALNAAGIWCRGVAAKAGINIDMYPAKGALLVFGHRINNVVINRCRKSSDGDILVPGDTVSIIGTTSEKVPFEECDDVRVTREEVELLLREGSALCPQLASTRITRAYAGVRPLVTSGDDASGRSVSRGIVCLDHSERDGIDGLVTITGGKLMTYRLMGEIAADMICRKLGVRAVCRTAAVPLAGSEKVQKIYGDAAQKAASFRHGTMVSKIDFSDSGDRTLVCECENVSYAEIKYAVNELGVKTLEDLRRRTRLGMGTCQGSLCIRKAAAALAAALNEPERAEELARAYVNERWKGMMPVGWGDTLREMEYMRTVYKDGVFGKYEI